jgi:dimethylargininase
VASIDDTGTLDGGDVLKIDDLILVGISSRTNESGFLQLKQFFEQAGARVEQIPVSGSLHLKSIITALPDKTVLYHKDRLPAETREALTQLGLTLLVVPEEKGVNVIVLDENTVMVQASA